MPYMIRSRSREYNVRDGAKGQMLKVGPLWVRFENLPAGTPETGDSCLEVRPFAGDDEIQLLNMDIQDVLDKSKSQRAQKRVAVEDRPPAEEPESQDEPKKKHKKH